MARTGRNARGQTEREGSVRARVSVGAHDRRGPGPPTARGGQGRPVAGQRTALTDPSNGRRICGRSARLHQGRRRWGQYPSSLGESGAGRTRGRTARGGGEHTTASVQLLTADGEETEGTNVTWAHGRPAAPRRPRACPASSRAQPGNPTKLLL